MEPRDEFACLMQRVQQGSEDAVKELLELYGHHIFRVVRRRLDQRLRAKYDSQDFAQSVWASFFAVGTRERAFDNPEALVAYLVKTARNKVVEVVRRRYGAQKRDIRRERSLEGSAALDARTLADAGQTPSQVLGAREQWARLVDKLPTHQKVMLELLYQGYTHQEIADRVGFSEKTIRRLISRIAPELLPNGSTARSPST